MAPRKSSSPGKSARNYRKNPASYKKKLAADKRRNSTPAQKAYRARLAAERRKRGMMGKGGSDLSHTKSGRLVKESPKKNRARNGANGKSTRK